MKRNIQNVKSEAYQKSLLWAARLYTIHVRILWLRLGSSARIWPWFALTSQRHVVTARSRIVEAKSKEDLKSAVVAEIDRRANEVVGVAKQILDQPEPGFREQKTSRLVGDKFREFGVPFDDGIALTGLKGMLSGGSSGPTVAVMGELDSLIVLGHPHNDPETNAAHACGHHAQIGSMLGVALGLQAPGVMESLAGRVALIAVPAEEYIEIEYRNGLRLEGKLEFLGGKAEMIRLGVLDDVDMAMMTHTEQRDMPGKLGVGATNNGMVAKWIRFTGVAAHAGAYPYDGINALNAANIALTGIHAQRETFRDEDSIRIHPIITQGGIAVSSVPADVRMETFVRGSSIEAIKSAAGKVDRALRAGAMAVGGSVSVTTLPGYLPIKQDQALEEVYVANASRLVGQDQVVRMGHRSGSTDMGDVSQIMPAVHPYAAAATGKPHGADYIVEDYDTAVVAAAKAMATTVVDLLADGARGALEVKSKFRPSLTKRRYLSLLRGMASEETYKE